MSTPVLCKTWSGAAAAFLPGQQTKVRAIYVVSGIGATTVNFWEGADMTGDLKIPLVVPASAQKASIYLLLPGDGVPFMNGIFLDPGAALSVTFFYG